MGTSKKLVLASFVSMILVLAFMIGLVPAHDSQGIKAAGSTDGHVNMVELVDMILGTKQVTGVTLSSKIDNVVFKTPDDNTQTPQIPVPVSANVAGGDSELVTFVANPDNDPTAFPDPNRWAGDVFSAPVSFPFASVLDIGSFITGTANTTTALAIYALVDTAQVAKAVTLSYTAANEPADALHITLIERPSGTDADNNAYPDTPFGEIQPGQVWVANETVNGTLRTVMLANLDNPGVGSKQLGTVFLSPDSNVQVESPNLAALQNAGIIGAGESALLAVSVTDTLAGALDNVDGDASATAINQYVSQLLGNATGPLTTGSPFVQIAIISSTNGDASQPRQIHDLGNSGLGVNLTINNLTVGPNDVVQLWELPDSVSNPQGSLKVSGLAAEQKWNVVGGAQQTGSVLNATLTSFSIFAAFNSGIRLDSATPANVPQNLPYDVTLTGIFPTLTALNLYQAQNAYRVYMNGLPATFRLGPAKQLDVAVTAFDGTNPNNMYVTTPSLPNLGPVLVQVVDLVNPGNQDAKSGLLQVVATAHVTTSVSGNTGAASITLTPPNGAGLPAGVYFLGTSVTAAQTSNTATDTFSGFTLNGVAVPTNPLTFVVNSDTTLVANFTPAITGFVLNLSAVGGGVVAASPTPDVNGRYAPGTVVTLTALPDANRLFVNYTGANAGDLSDPNSAVATITMNSDKTIVANFIANDRGTLTTSTNGNGTVTVNPVQPNNGYLVGTVVTLTAVPDPGNAFVNWTGPNAANLSDQNSAATTITIAVGNQSVTANFTAVTATATLTLNTDGNGTVTVNPTSANGQYPVGSTVTLTAIPNNGFVFDRFVGPGAADLVPNANSATATITLQASTSLTALFRRPLAANSVTPDNAWIFGGVVAELSGAGFTDQTQITIGGVTVQGFRPAADGSTIDFIVPPTTDTSNAATVLVDIVTSDNLDTITISDAFTYKRYEETADATTTAFIFDGLTGTTVGVSTGAPHDPSTFATLEIPGLDLGTGGSTTVYGIARDAFSQGGTVVTKLNTAALGTALITEGQSIPNVLDFSVHFYREQAAKQNTPPAGSPIFFNANQLLDVDRSLDANGNPTQGTPMRLTFDTSSSKQAGGLTIGDVRNGLMWWGIKSTFDYVTEQTTIVEPPVVQYQSELLSNPAGGLPQEVSPAALTGTPDSTTVDVIQRARLYSLNGFSLRRNAVIDAEVAAGIRLDTPSGTANGPIAGGTQLHIVSALGGLAYVDRIVLTDTAKAGGVVRTFVTVPGTDENNLVFLTPPSTASDPGIVDLTIFLKSNPNVPAVTLDRVFEYTAQPTAAKFPLLLLLGLLIAILGLAAGGHSGGGGGGPCFIATAAYGTPMAAEIDTLRDVRDQFMLTNKIGTAFVDTYYHVSPAIADVVAKNPVLAALVRVVLVPVIFLGKMALASPGVFGFAGFALAAAYMLLRRKAKSRA